MRKIRAKTRPDWVKAALGRERKYTEGQAVMAFQKLALEGWVTAMPPYGPAWEMVAMVHVSSPLAAIVTAAGGGQALFDQLELDDRLGAPVASRNGCEVLGSAGLAIAGADSCQVILQPYDPQGAKLINESRCHFSRKGYLARTVIEAILPVHNPARRHANAKDARRLDAAIILESFQISADDLLDDRRWVRLKSHWMFSRSFNGPVPTVSAFPKDSEKDAA